jgi:hypothetical protein
MIKFKTYTDAMLAYALADCYATLEAGQYAADHPYGRKLWLEIDAIRDVQMSRRSITRAVYRRIKAGTLAAGV